MLHSEALVVTVATNDDNLLARKMKGRAQKHSPTASAPRSHFFGSVNFLSRFDHSLRRNDLPRGLSPSGFADSYPAEQMR